MSHADAFAKLAAAAETGAGTVEAQRPADRPPPRTATARSDAPAAGRLVPFDLYLAAASRGRQQPTHWSWQAVSQALPGGAHGERGTVALAAAAGTGGGRVEAAPGISLTVQVVEPQRSTRAHRHSFWHLYVVLSGEGTAHIDDAPAFRLAPGDSFYVPPWSSHRLANADEHTPLMLYGLQNLPQLAELGTLVRESPDGDLEHVYRAADRDSAA